MSIAPDKTGQIKFTSSSVFRPIHRPTLSVSLLLVWQTVAGICWSRSVQICRLQCVPSCTGNGVPSNPCSDLISFSPHVFRSRRHLLASKIRQVASTHLKDKQKRQGRSANLGQALSYFVLFSELPHHKSLYPQLGKSDRGTQTKVGNGCLPFG
jgi:hypothetical protein